MISVGIELVCEHPSSCGQGVITISGLRKFGDELQAIRNGFSFRRRLSLHESDAFRLLEKLIGISLKISKPSWNIHFLKFDIVDIKCLHKFHQSCLFVECTSYWNCRNHWVLHKNWTKLQIHPPNMCHYKFILIERLKKAGERAFNELWSLFNSKFYVKKCTCIIMLSALSSLIIFWVPGQMVV